MHIFISYAKKDTYNLAIQLRDIFRAIEGLTVWMDESLEAAESWASQIQEEIDRADLLVVLLSPDLNRPETQTQRRSFVLNEIDYAQSHEVNKPILPVMAQKTRMPVQIAGIQYIDLTQNQLAGIEKLVNKVCREAGVQNPLALTYVQATVPVISSVWQNSKLRLVGVFLLIGIIFALFFALPDYNGKSSEDAKTRVVQNNFTTTQTPSLTMISNTPNSNNDTQQDEPENTQTITPTISPTDTSTSTATVTLEITTSTQSPSDTFTPIPSNTSTATATLTPTPSNSPTNTPLPTFTPTPTPTTTIQLELTQIIRNAQWQPVIQSFSGIDMVLAPIGCFTMGSNDGDFDERPSHLQCSDKPFWIDRTEVTREMYNQCIQDGSCTTTPYSDYSNQPNQPINRITWFQADGYCRWRSARLPTEVEWEYAARGPDSLTYTWSSDFISGNVVWAANSETSQPVGSNPNVTSWIGSLDILGNVWEWIHTIYVKDYPYDAQDGRESETDASSLRGQRGGSFLTSDPYQLRASFRGAYGPNIEYIDVGFRCAKDY